MSQLHPLSRIALVAVSSSQLYANARLYGFQLEPVDIHTPSPFGRWIQGPKAVRSSHFWFVLQAGMFKYWVTKHTDLEKVGIWNLIECEDYLLSLHFLARHNTALPLNAPPVLFMVCKAQHQMILTVHLKD